MKTLKEHNAALAAQMKIIAAANEEIARIKQSAIDNLCLPRIGDTVVVTTHNHAHGKAIKVDKISAQIGYFTNKIEGFRVTGFLFTKNGKVGKMRGYTDVDVTP